MADLTEIQAAQLVKLTGASSTGVEQTPVQSTSTGALHVEAQASGIVSRSKVVGSVTLQNAGSELLNVNGAVTPVTFQAGPSGSDVWYVESLSILLFDATKQDITEFASLATLTNGVLWRQVLSSTSYDIMTSRTNYQLVLQFPQIGLDSSAGKFLNVDGAFIASRIFYTPLVLNGATSDKIQAIIRDDLTGIDNFYVGINYYRVL